MFRVDLRFLGQGLWNSSALPMTIQAAVGRARALEDTKFADHVRVVPTSGEPRIIDLKV